MIPKGKTLLNLKFDSQTWTWQFTVGRTDNGNVTSWQFGLDHAELTQFRDGLIELIDDVEQQAGSILRDQD